MPTLLNNKKPIERTFIANVLPVKLPCVFRVKKVSILSTALSAVIALK